MAYEIANNGSTSETTTYSYDLNGNLVSKSTPLSTTNYTYNVWGNMSSGAGATYGYNSQGLRTYKTVGNETDNFVLVGGNVWSDGEADYFRGIELISNGTQLYLYNIRGDVIQLVGFDGEVNKTYDYDAYGNELQRDLNDENPFRYCGEYYDTETGFIYLRARYYDLMVGRFTSIDPIKSGLNWYSYCDNNPVNRIDPTGEDWLHWALGALIVAGCAAAVVLTAGGVLAGATAVGMVASGVAAFSTASTVASGAFIGSSMVFGGCALGAAFSSDTPQEFAEQGNWGTVAATAGGAVFGALIGYITDRNSQKATKYVSSPNDVAENAGDIVDDDNVKSVKTVDKLIDSVQENTTSKNGTRNFVSSGGYDQAVADFDSLGPKNVTEINTSHGTGKLGYIDDSIKIVARPFSKTGGATLEIHLSHSRIYKIRY